MELRLDPGVWAAGAVCLAPVHPAFLRGVSLATERRMDRRGEERDEDTG